MNTFGQEYGVVMEAPGNNKDCSQVRRLQVLVKFSVTSPLSARRCGWMKSLCHVCL